MSKRTYYPDRGDLVHLNFSPSASHEMTDRHFALVISTASFARKTDFALVCPITSNTSPWPFDVLLARGTLPAKQGVLVDSVIAIDQLKSLDYRDRECEFVCKAPDEVLDLALLKIRAIIDSDDVVEECK